MSPGSLYQMSSPYPVQPMTLTGQMRLFEVDEIPSQYKPRCGAPPVVHVHRGRRPRDLGRRDRDVPHHPRHPRRRPVARTARSWSSRCRRAPRSSTTATRLAGVTPITIDEVPIGSRHEIKVVSSRGTPSTSTTASTCTKIPPEPQGLRASSRPSPAGSASISKPEKADILINGEIKGVTPKTDHRPGHELDQDRRDPAEGLSSPTSRS